MGAAIACNLLRSGVDVTLYDLNGDANVPDVLRDGLDGAKWANSAAEAASATNVVITALPKPEHVSAAFECKDGIFDGLNEGSVWIEHSTTDFENTLRIKNMVESKNSHAVEAPITGGMQLLREGKMVALVGADPEVFEGTIASLVALSAPRIVRCGEFGHATVIKILSNILCAVHDVAVGEALCIAKKAGLDLKLVFDAMRVSSGNSFCWETEVPLALRGEYDPNFTAEMMIKDISLGLDIANRLDVPTPVFDECKNLYDEALDKFGTSTGSSIPIRLSEEKAGVRLCEGPGSAKEAFKDWTYTSEITNGSFQVSSIPYSIYVMISFFLFSLSLSLNTISIDYSSRCR